jgi:hypothetical protein
VQKRILLAALFAGWLPAAAFAQSIESGVKGGVTFATVPQIGPALDFDSSTTDYRAGVTAGGFVTYDVNDWFGVQPELLYVQKGVEVTRTDEAAAPADRFEMDYLEIPVLARFSGGPSDTRLYLLAGPTFGIRLNGTVQEKTGEVTIERDVGDELKRSDVGLTVGGGVEAGFLLVEARYTEGLTNINKPDSPLLTDVHNRTFSFMAGVVF